MDKIFIGIDAGSNTGFSVWNATKKCFTEISTYTFWETIDKLSHYNQLFESDDIKLTVVIEDVLANKPTFNRGKVGSVQNRISQNVGSNKRDCQLLIEWLELKKIPVLRIRPTKSSLTKLPVDRFKTITGHQKSTSQHGRDASMLVFNR